MLNNIITIAVGLFFIILFIILMVKSKKTINVIVLFILMIIFAIPTVWCIFELIFYFMLR